jgi:cytochrome P450
VPLPSASVVENVQFNRLVIVPNALQGTFRRRPKPVSLATRLDVDAAAVRFMATMRRAYGPGPVWVRVVTDRALLVLDVADIRRVLEGSPDPFAPDPPPKRKGMEHFQPDALTLSRGALWQERRRFTEAVLDSAATVHRLGDAAVAIAREEARAMLERSRGELEWSAWHDAFRRIARRVILGEAAAGDEAITGMLAELMSGANRMAGGPSKEYDAFAARVRGYVEADEPGGLVALFAEAQPGPDTAAAGQIPHWMFALGDTLAANALRALAVVAAHPDARAAVSAELGAAPGDDARAVAGLRHVRAALQEAMRLWPTTPLLARVTTRPVQFGDEVVPADTQVLFVNAFHHRDRDHVPYADRFAPGEWIDGDAAAYWGFNHFSHGPQGCPGVSLSLLLGAAVLAEVLGAHGAVLTRPRLDPSKPLPYMLDFHGIRLALRTPAEHH